MVMMQLYCVLVLSNMDYGSFVCGSTMKSKLSTIDPVHNGIHLAIGAFRTNLLEFICGIWRTPTLPVEYLLLCSNAGKLST